MRNPLKRDKDRDEAEKEPGRHAITERHKRSRGRVHLDTAREAGFSRVSGLSVLSGTMCAYGAFAIVAAIAGSILSNTDLEADFRTDDWTSSGAAAGLVTALVLFAAYVFGGYVAGRMARRSGVLHGIGVFVLSLIVGLFVGSMTSMADGVDLADNLRSIGVPTEWDQVESVGVAAAIASLLAMFLGASVGGTLGERWHTKLANRIDDPAYGPAAEARARAEREERAHRERLNADPVVAAERPPMDLGTPPYRTASAHEPDRKVDLRDHPVGQPVDATYNRTDGRSDPDDRGVPAPAEERVVIDETIDLRPPPPDGPTVADDQPSRDVPSGGRTF